MTKINLSVESFLDRFAAAFLMGLGALIAGAVALV
jgi:hypothetical protein